MRENFLSYNRLREWTEIHRQLLQLTARAGMVCHARRDAYDPIHRALLTGFLSGIALRSSEVEYTGAGGVSFHLWPGSGLFRAKPKWCLVAEVIETSRRYGRVAGRIQAGWIEPLAQHLVKRTYSDPHWHRQSGSVMAFERVALFGLPIATRRRVPYGTIDADVVRDLFLREGLRHRQGLEPSPEQEEPLPDAFFRHNQRVIDEANQLAAKARQGAGIVDEYRLYRYYDAQFRTAPATSRCCGNGSSRGGAGMPRCCTCSCLTSSTPRTGSRRPINSPKR